MGAPAPLEGADGRARGMFSVSPAPACNPSLQRPSRRRLAWSSRPRRRWRRAAWTPRWKPSASPSSMRRRVSCWGSFAATPPFRAFAMRGASATTSSPSRARRCGSSATASVPSSPTRRPACCTCPDAPTRAAWCRGAVTRPTGSRSPRSWPGRSSRASPPPMPRIPRSFGTAGYR